MPNAAPRFSVALVLLGLLALGATALPAGPALASEEAGDTDDKDDNGNGIPLPTLIAPVVEGKRLVGYIYLAVRLTAANKSAADHLRDILPQVQDSLLRALNNAPVPADVAATPAAKDSVAKTVAAALDRLGESRGIQDIALTDFQNVPF